MNAPCILPSRWKKQDQIAIVAPSFYYDPSKIKPGLSRLQSWGFLPKIPENLEKREGYFAGSDQHRLQVIKESFLSSDIKGLFCVRGGYGASRLLSNLPYQAIQKHAKVLVGFSDITALALALYTKCKLISVHGPMLGTLDWDQESSEKLRLLLSGNPVEPMYLSNGFALSPGKTQGRLLGGNLSLITSLLGTPYFPDLEGSILYLEEVDEKPYHIDRMLTQLELAGCFEKLAGILIGDFFGCTDDKHPEPSCEEVLALRLSDKNVPVLAGFPGGHGRVNWPLLIGATTTLDADQKTLKIEEHLQ